MHFDAKRGIRYIGDIAIDDFSMSPECFGLNIPGNQLDGYNYWNPDIEKPFANIPHKDFVNETCKYIFYKIHHTYFIYICNYNFNK